MVKQKKLITISEIHWNMLNEIMDEKGLDSIFDVIKNIFAEEYKRREEAKTKRPVGRPRKEEGEEEEEEFDLEKEFADDLPKNITWYGTKIGERQFKYYEELQKNFKAK